MNRKLIKDLMDAIKASDRKKTSGYDTSAVVRRIEDGTAWVHIPGGVDETPVKLTINASVGDTVQVRVSGGRAFLVGNRTAPPTDDTTAIKATYVAKNAQETAVEAKSEASEAWHYAGTAKEAAESAQDSADSAAEAAIEAWDHADEAQQAAVSANNSANSALTQLSVVEDVAGTLNWIREHGSFVQTTDVTVQENTVYFELINGEYVPIAQPDQTKNPSEEGWYVLDVSDSQAEYIMAHLAVTSAGLWVLPFNTLASHPLIDSDDNDLVDSDDNQLVDWSKDPQNADGYKALFASDGMTIYDNTGTSVAHYGTTTTIGAEMGKHVYIDTDALHIMNGDTVLASYGSTTKFYEPDGVTEAAEISANGMHVKQGQIGVWSIWGKTLTSDGTAELIINNEISSGNYRWMEVKGDEVRVWDQINSVEHSYASLGIDSIEIQKINNSGFFVGNAKLEPAKIWAEGEGIEVDSGVRNTQSGRIYLYTQGTVGGNRGIYSYNSSEVSKSVLVVNDNNVASFYGKADSVSDRKKKYIIDDYDWQIDEFIQGLKPIAYKSKYDNGSSGDRVHMGFVAQDVRDLVRTLYDEELSLYQAKIVDDTKNGPDRESDYHGEDIDDSKLSWTLTYSELIAPAILEIQRLMKRVDELEAKIKEMEV